MIETQDAQVWVLDAQNRTQYLTRLSSTCRIDEGAAPYATWSLTIARPSLAVYALLDPQARKRVTMSVARRTRGLLPADFASTRYVDLLVTERTLNLDDGTVTLTLSSLEAVMAIYAPTEPINLGGLQGSVRDIAKAVINRMQVGAFLQDANAADAPFPTAYTLTNLIAEGGFDYALSARWAGNFAALGTDPSYGVGGSGSLRIRPTGASTDSFAAVDAGLRAGRTYRVAGKMTLPVAQTGALAPRARSISIMATINGAEVQTAASVQVPNVASTTPVEVSVQVTIPENATDTRVRLNNGSTSTDVYWDEVRAYEGTGTEADGTLVPFFDGSSQDDARYVYTWDGDPGYSTSSRTARIERNPDMLVWQIGQTALTFLTPILQTVGLRLFCDEQSVWRLVDTSYLPRGLVKLTTGDNIHTLSDRASLTSTHPDGSPLWADAVVVKYTWLDRNADTQVRYDIAAPAGYRRAWFVELQEPYPGPGRADYLLGRMQMRSRQLDVTARVDYQVTPGQEVTITTGDGTLQTGYVDAVEWDQTADDMTVRTKGLVDTPATAWNQLPYGHSWAASPVGASWASETA